MSNSPSRSPWISDLVLIGGGHAHVHLLKMYGMPPYRALLASHGIRCTLITSDILTPYSGMLPGMVSGHYAAEDMHIDLERLCSFSGFRLIHVAATGVVMAEAGGSVICADGRPPVRFDVLSIDVGSRPSLPLHAPSTRAADDDWGVIPVKPITGFSTRWSRICTQLETRLRQQTNLESSHKNSSNSHVSFSTDEPFTLVVVGGGAGGIELALAAQYALQKLLHKVSPSSSVDSIKVILVTRGKTLMESHNRSVQNIFQRILAQRNIDVHYDIDALGIEKYNQSMGLQKLIVSESSQPRQPILFHECLWCTSAGAPTWIAQNTPLETDTEGFIKVDSSYESVNIRGIFAAGDCCHMVHNPRPKAGVFAVRAGPILKDNLIAYLLQQPLTTHTPQQEFLGLITTGDKYAVASRGEHALEGAFLWDLKDQIDRSFMDTFLQLPSMDPMDTTSDESDTTTLNQRNFIPPNLNIHGIDALSAFASNSMRCGGCGSKVGSTTLSRVLNFVYQRRHRIRKSLGLSNILPDIPQDDAAVIMLPEHRGIPGKDAMVHTIDFFRSFISDPYIFGKVAAVHAMSDCHAMGCQPETALALAVCPYAAVESITESTLIDLLSGASDALEMEGCSLSGGHTCEGAELALGFSISSYCPDISLLLRKSGGQCGDQIVLTKPLGTGCIFAANMRAKCKGNWVADAIRLMTSSNGPASRIAVDIIRGRKGMTDSGIHACTDVTGFGLIGHLLEMLLSNDSVQGCDSIGATLHLNAIPFLEGALDAVSNQIFSSLYKDNVRTRRAIRNHEATMESSPIKYPILFDPQTAGGLLFFVSPDVCHVFLRRLSEIPGCEYTSVIGEVNPFSDNSHTESMFALDSCGKRSGERIVVLP